MASLRIIENGRIRKIPYIQGHYYLWGIEIVKGVSEIYYRPFWIVTRSEGYITIEVGDITIYLSRRRPYIKIYSEQRLVREEEITNDN